MSDAEQDNSLSNVDLNSTSQCNNALSSSPTMSPPSMAVDDNDNDADQPSSADIKLKRKRSPDDQADLPDAKKSTLSNEELLARLKKYEAANQVLEAKNQDLEAEKEDLEAAAQLSAATTQQVTYQQSYSIAISQGRSKSAGDENATRLARSSDTATPLTVCPPSNEWLESVAAVPPFLSVATRTAVHLLSNHLDQLASDNNVLEKMGAQPIMRRLLVLSTREDPDFRVYAESTPKYDAVHTDGEADYGTACHDRPVICKKTGVGRWVDSALLSDKGRGASSLASSLQNGDVLTQRSLNEHAVFVVESKQQLEQPDSRGALTGALAKAVQQAQHALFLTLPRGVTAESYQRFFIVNDHENVVFGRMVVTQGLAAINITPPQSLLSCAESLAKFIHLANESMATDRETLQKTACVPDAIADTNERSTRSTTTGRSSTTTGGSAVWLPVLRMLPATLAVNDCIGTLPEGRRIVRFLADCPAGADSLSVAEIRTSSDLSLCCKWLNFAKNERAVKTLARLQKEMEMHDTVKDIASSHIAHGGKWLEQALVTAPVGEELFAYSQRVDNKHLGALAALVWRDIGSALDLLHGKEYCFVDLNWHNVIVAYGDLTHDIAALRQLLGEEYGESLLRGWKAKQQNATANSAATSPGAASGGGSTSGSPGKAAAAEAAQSPSPATAADGLRCVLIDVESCVKLGSERSSPENSTFVPPRNETEREIFAEDKMRPTTKLHDFHQLFLMCYAIQENKGPGVFKHHDAAFKALQRNHGAEKFDKFKLEHVKKAGSKLFAFK